jgi:hypothetical protein
VKQNNQRTLPTTFDFRFSFEGCLSPPFPQPESFSDSHRQHDFLAQTPENLLHLFTTGSSTEDLLEIPSGVSFAPLALDLVNLFCCQFEFFFHDRHNGGYHGHSAIRSAGVGTENRDTHSHYQTKLVGGSIPLRVRLAGGWRVCGIFFIQ